MQPKFRSIALVALLFAAVVLGSTVAKPALADEPVKQQVYELRTYTVIPGRMPAMLARFRDHTTRLFEKHGIRNIGYWTPQGPEAETKLVYLLAHDSKETADKNWQAFRDDPEWKVAKDNSEKDGKIVEKAESLFLSPTDFSKLK
jgi:hypothetical protein